MYDPESLCLIATSYCAWYIGRGSHAYSNRYLRTLMVDNTRERITQAPVFSSLNKHLTVRAVQEIMRRTYSGGSCITFQDDIWPYLFLVDTGRIDAVKESSEGRQLIVMSLYPGDIFWGLAFFDEQARNPVTLMAQESSKVLIWPREQLLPILMEEPQAMWNLSQQMVLRMQQASQIVEGLAFQPVVGRLARLLLDRFAQVGENSMGRDMTLDEIAAKIGTTRENACRALYQFSDQDLIRITRTEFTLTDEEGLSRIADKS